MAAEGMASGQDSETVGTSVMTEDSEATGTSVVIVDSEAIGTSAVIADSEAIGTSDVAVTDSETMTVDSAAVMDSAAMADSVPVIAVFMATAFTEVEDSTATTTATNFTAVKGSAATADIMATGLTVTGITASSKLYDRTVTATLDTSSAALSGVVGGDTVTLGASATPYSVTLGQISVAKALTISGADARTTLIAGDGSSRIFSVSSLSFSVSQAFQRPTISFWKRVP